MDHLLVKTTPLISTVCIFHELIKLIVPEVTKQKSPAPLRTSGNVAAAGLAQSGGGGGVLVTVTKDVAVKPPLTDVAVMVAVPAATPVTTPLALTVAIKGLLEVQVTDLFVALAGETVAVSGMVPAIATLAVVGVTLTPVAGTGTTAVTVTTAEAVKLPLWVVAVILATPAARAVTIPDVLTVATAGLLELQVTALLVAFAGATVADNVVVPPAATETVAGETVTPVVGTFVVVLLPVASKWPPLTPER